jgi:hypothetical protein
MFKAPVLDNASSRPSLSCTCPIHRLSTPHYPIPMSFPLIKRLAQLSSYGSTSALYGHHAQLSIAPIGARSLFQEGIYIPLGCVVHFASPVRCDIRPLYLFHSIKTSLFHTYFPLSFMFFIFPFSVFLSSFSCFFFTCSFLSYLKRSSLLISHIKSYVP